MSTTPLSGKKIKIPKHPKALNDNEIDYALFQNRVEILFQKQEDLFYEARTIWIVLEEWSATDKVSEISEIFFIKFI